MGNGVSGLSTYVWGLVVWGWIFLWYWHNVIGKMKGICYRQSELFVNYSGSLLLNRFDMDMFALIGILTIGPRVYLAGC